MSRLFWLLVLCCAVSGRKFPFGIVNTIWNKTVDQRDKFQEVFDLIQHKKVQCTATNNEQGTCVSRKDCSDLGGLASGSCARNWGICCVLHRTCGSSTKFSGTYFTNPGYPGTIKERLLDCSITVSKTNPNICQLRLDFLDFTLTQPDHKGECVSDIFKVTGGSYVPPLCGGNAEQHVYVDFLSDSTPIKASIRTSQTSESCRWNIKITQIECNSPQRGLPGLLDYENEGTIILPNAGNYMPSVTSQNTCTFSITTVTTRNLACVCLFAAPPNVLMYFTDVEGNVKSFNYDPSPPVDPLATRQLFKLNYVVGVQLAPGYCAIEWKQDSSDDKYSFTVSGDTDSQYDLLGNHLTAVQGDSCTSNFVIIPNSDVGRDRFCGSAFVTIKTFTKPFTLTVVTDNQELLDMGNRGFSLMYRQLLCS